jgi:hypothetical protein
MNGMTLFEAAEEAKREAMERVDTHANPDWKATALQAVLWLANDREHITSDDVWDLLNNRDVETHEPRALGAIMKRVAQGGFIEVTDRYVPSRRAACHGRPIRVWRSRTFRP